MPNPFWARAKEISDRVARGRVTTASKGNARRTDEPEYRCGGFDHDVGLRREAEDDARRFRHQ